VWARHDSASSFGEEDISLFEIASLPRQQRRDKTALSASAGGGEGLQGGIAGFLLALLS